MTDTQLTVEDLRRCIEGRIPPVIATASSSGEPNVIYLSAVHIVDAERLTLSNIFLSKTATNLADNPRASLLLIDPVSGLEYRLQIVYERTERRGRTFERLKTEVDEIGELTGMDDSFRLRTADIYRVESIEVIDQYPGEEVLKGRGPRDALAGLGELSRRLARCSHLDMMVGAALRGLDELLGYRHTLVMLLDEPGERLFTIASHGFDAEGVGSEVAVGRGAAGLAAQRNQPVRQGGMRYDEKYASSIRQVIAGDSREIAVPTFAACQSRLAVPAVSRGQVLGVLVVESPDPAAFDETDETVLGIVGSLLAEMVELEREASDDDPQAADVGLDSPGDATEADHAVAAAPTSGEETHIRFFASDGSVFLDGDYLIRGVAGRILWSLAHRHAETGQVEFTTKEIRLDKSLELPSFRDNLDTRLILLKRRLDERAAPIRIDRIGRGKIALRLDTTLRFEAHD